MFKKIGRSIESFTIRDGFTPPKVFSTMTLKEDNSLSRGEFFPLGLIFPTKLRLNFWARWSKNYVLQ